MKEYFVRTSVLSFAAALVLGLGACSSSGGGGDDGGAAGTTATSFNGSAALSGTMATSSSSTPSASRVSAANVVVGVDEEASAELVVDGNGDGVFGPPDVVYSSSVMMDGSFEFQNIEIPKEGVTQAQLSVSKEGYAPVTKIINLSDGQSTSVVAEAGTLPVFTEVVAIDRNTTTAGSYLKIGMKQSSTGVSSYARIMSLDELRAEATDPSFGEDELSTSVIPIDAIPDDVVEVRADMKAFDPTDPEDSKYFPGEYKGEGKDGTTEASRLVSVGFDLVSLRDQNGNPIELDTDAIKASKLRPQAIDYDNCLQTKTRYLSDTQVTLIEEMGDDDNTTEAFEIPMWYYDYSSGIWKYLGEAEYTNATDSMNGRAYATMCVTENWGEYLNLDYDFAITQPKTICIKAQDQFGEDVGNLNFTMQNGTAYTYAYLDTNGEGHLALTAGDTLSDYDISYSGSLTSWATVQVPTSDIEPNSTNEDCDYDLNVTVQNPYSTTLRVTPQEIDGSAGTDVVYVRNSDYRSYYYQTATADEDGVATFKIKPNTSYKVRYRSKDVSITANGTVVTPETADSTRAVSVVVQDENVAPDVTVQFYSTKISDRATSVKFRVGTNDANGDTITFNGLTLNGTPLVEGTHYSVISRYTGDSYDSIYGDLNLSNADVSAITPTSLSEGGYELKATYSDGTSNGDGSATFEVLGNRAPVINGVYFYNSTRGYTRLDDVIPVGSYSVYAYAYDPNGDTVTLTYTLDGVAVAESTMDLTNGEHTIVVTASDGFLDSNRTFNVLVGNHPPVVTYAGAKSYTVDIASTDNTINLFAYVSDREDGTQVKSVQAVDQNGTKYPFAFNSSRWMYEAEISPNAVGTYVFNVTATDNNDTNSSASVVSVQTIQNNQAPVFTQELTSETVDVRSEKTFRCEATDPEGTFVSYSWMIDEEVQSTTSTTLTYTFSTTGQVNISCTASDEDGKSSTTSARITVVDPTQTGTLVVNTPMEGLLIALHDLSTMEPTGVQQLTGTDGSARFNVVGDRVSFSVSLTSDTIMGEKELMDSVKSFLLSSAYSTCNAQPETNTTCSSMDWCAAYASDTIPNWIVALNPPTDENGTVIATAEEVDTNNDGAIDYAETLAIMLQMDDTNGDGQISWGEFNDDREMITTQMYLSVPVREYTLDYISSNMFEGERVSSYISFENGCYESEAYPDFNLTVTNLTPNTGVDLRVSGSGYGYSYLQADASGNVTFTVNTYNVGDNGKFDFLVKKTDENGSSTYYQLEEELAALQGGSITISASNFSDPKRVEVVQDVANESLHLEALGNGISFDIYSPTTPTLDGYAMDIFEMQNTQYNISTYLSSYADGIYIGYSTRNYYGDGTLLSRYIMSDYPQLDVTVVQTDTGIELGGGDFGKLNLFRVDLSVYSSFGFNLGITGTQVPTNIGDFNSSKVLPQDVQDAITDFSQELLEQNYLYGYMNLYEYKDQTETSILDALTGLGSESDYEQWYLLPVRQVYFSLSGGADSSSLISAQSTSEKASASQITNPFAIGLDVSKAW